MNEREGLRTRNHFVVAVATACLEQEVEFNLTLLLLVKAALVQKLRDARTISPPLEDFEVMAFCRREVAFLARSAA